MTLLVMLFALFAAAVAQIAIPGFSALAYAKVPFLLAVVLYYALTRRKGTAFLAAISAGLVHDALGGIPLGYTSFCFCIIALGVNWFREMVFGESLVTTAFFGAVGGGLATLLTYALLFHAGLIDLPLWWVALKTVCTAVLCAICTPLVFGAVLCLDRMVGNIHARKDSVDEKIRYV